MTRVSGATEWIVHSESASALKLAAMPNASPTTAGRCCATAAPRLSAGTSDPRWSTSNPAPSSTSAIIRSPSTWCCPATAASSTRSREPVLARFALRTSNRRISPRWLIDVARCSSATVTAPDSHSSPIQTLAGAMTSD